MGRLIGALGMGFFGLMIPIVLVAGAVGAMAKGSSTGSSSPLIHDLLAAGYENGRLPDTVLTVVSTRPGYDCRLATVGSADRAWMALVVAARLDGVDLEGGWCYRTYQEQLQVWTRRQCYIPGNCDGDPYPPTARPGTSLHGWGLAVDVWGPSSLTLTCSSPEFLWMRLNAGRFGWVHPEWAACGRDAAEPWHWEYVGSEFVVTSEGE